MSVMPLDEYLASFRNRTKLRGDTFQEKLDTYLNRLEKVALDCEASSDGSIYRTKYGDIHRLEFKNIKDLQEENPNDLKSQLIKYLDYLQSHLKEIHDAYYTNYNEYQFDMVGTIDGLCYIVVELEEVVK